MYIREEYISYIFIYLVLLFYPLIIIVVLYRPSACPIIQYKENDGVSRLVVQKIRERKKYLSHKMCLNIYSYICAN